MKKIVICTLIGLMSFATFLRCAEQKKEQDLGAHSKYLREVSPLFLGQGRPKRESSKTMQNMLWQGVQRRIEQERQQAEKTIEVVNMASAPVNIDIIVERFVKDYAKWIKEVTSKVYSNPLYTYWQYNLFPDKNPAVVTLKIPIVEALQFTFIVHNLIRKDSHTFVPVILNKRQIARMVRIELTQNGGIIYFEDLQPKKIEYRIPTGFSQDF